MKEKDLTEKMKDKPYVKFVKIADGLVIPNIECEDLSETLTIMSMGVFSLMKIVMKEEGFVKDGKEKQFIEKIKSIMFDDIL